jgi:hypothetical protein
VRIFSDTPVWSRDHILWKEMRSTDSTRSSVWRKAQTGAKETDARKPAADIGDLIHLQVDVLDHFVAHQEILDQYTPLVAHA